MYIRKLSFFYFYLAISALIVIPYVSLIGNDMSKSETAEKKSLPNNHVIRFSVVSIIGETNDYSKIRQIFAVSQKASCAGILVLIDSVGGSPGPAALISEAVIRATKCKPLISYVCGNALSAGYLIAASAPYIMAAPLSIVGSIGYCINIKNSENITRFSESEFKFIRFDKKGNILPKHAAVNNELAACGGAIFNDQIVGLRPTLTHQEIIDMQAKCFMGPDSMKHKLVDRIGSLTEAVAELYQRSGSPACDYVELINSDNVLVAIFDPQELLAAQQSARS